MQKEPHGGISMFFMANGVTMHPLRMGTCTSTRLRRSSCTQAMSSRSQRSSTYHMPLARVFGQSLPSVRKPYYGRRYGSRSRHHNIQGHKPIQSPCKKHRAGSPYCTTQGQTAGVNKLVMVGLMTSQCEAAQSLLGEASFLASARSSSVFASIIERVSLNVAFGAHAHGVERHVASFLERDAVLGMPHVYHVHVHYAQKSET